MYCFSFVVLHYLSYESTAACVHSILDMYGASGTTINIIVVDNASPDDSFTRLQTSFPSDERLHWIRAEKNLGFARGNNLGYRYALRKLHSDFIVIANNDTVFDQSGFLDELCLCYDEASVKPALIGPDIRNINGSHQNPYRDHVITDREIRRWIRNRRLWTIFLYLDKYLHLSRRIGFFRDYYARRSLAGRPAKAWQHPASNVVLQGACIIFTPAFTEQFKEYAFYPETFMYCEEDIIACLCADRGLSTLYTPKLFLTHKEAVSTSLSSHGSTLDKELFMSRHIVRSLKVLRRLKKELR